MRAITVCVNYSDILVNTLPRMLENFEHVTVVTDPQDLDTYRLCSRYENVRILRTEIFYKDGSEFNKGAALDEALALAHGWTCIIDADILLPKVMDIEPEVGCLYSPFRRLLLKPGPVPQEAEWCRLPEGWERRNKEFAGYFQLFHTDDPCFGSGPWCESKWTTAQGCDTVFFKRWPLHNLRRITNFEVLHLGPLKVNWSGRVSEKWNQ